MNSSVPPMIKTRRLFQPPVQSRSVTRCRAFICLLVFSCLLSQFLLSSFQRATLVGIRALEAADISYIYEELGRLRAVVDPGSDTAVYNYDAVGNLLSITRQSSSIVSIIEFIPDSGPVGTSVTIFGTGFSTTPSQNTVTFNGVSASVTSSTTTQIVATVPVGATTGVIGVTAPGGSAASAQVFTVTSTTGAPTITGFTPTIGVAGTAVTVTGTNFETVPSNNVLKFNQTYAPVISPTTTSLNTTVPFYTASGPISVTIPKGKAVSSSDFFIPPAPYTASDVEYTGRIILDGPSLTATINTANKVGLVVFDATAGQTVSLGVNSSTLHTSSKFKLYNPNGIFLADNGVLLNTNVNIHVTPTVTGTYTILVDPYTTNTGSVTLTLSSEVNAGTIVVDGASVTATTTRVGQRARMTFSGTAGQRVSLGVNSITGLSTSSTLHVYNPDGSLLATEGNLLNTGTNLHMTLPATGIYSILVDPFNVNVGSITLTLSSEVTGTILVDGPSITATIPRVGQRARITFSGTQGQIVSLGVNSITGLGTSSTMQVYDPNNNLIAEEGVFLDINDNYHMSLPAPGTATYTILIDPFTTTAGSITLTLSSEVNGGAITINGLAAPITIGRVGQRARLTFDTTTANQQARVGVTGNTMGSVTVSLYAPGGTTPLTSSTSSASSFNLATQTLVTVGTYTILVDPAGLNTGSMNVAVNTPLSLTLSFNGKIKDRERCQASGAVSGAVSGFIMLILFSRQPDNLQLRCA